MNEFELIAEPRTDVGRGASRRLRQAGKLPGIIYGAEKEAAAITLDHDDIVHHLGHEAFYSHILTVTMGKEKQKVVLKDLQRHPYKARILHIDLQRVSDTEKLTMRVPIHFINEVKCIGVKQGGGVISHIMSELEISCLPKDLPEFIEVDLADVNVGETIHVGDLKLPAGVESYAIAHGGDASAPVVSVHMPKVITEEEEEIAEVVTEVAADAVPATAVKEPKEPREES
jgi:large subunit ribosomal protein L25